MSIDFRWAVYDRDGRILQFLQTPDPAPPPMFEIGTAAVRCGRDYDQSSGYVADGQVVPRPTLPGFDKTRISADGRDVACLSGLPDPCVVDIDGSLHSVAGSRLELTAGYPGTYRIVIDHWPYRRFEETIQCVSP